MCAPTKNTLTTMTITTTPTTPRKTVSFASTQDVVTVERLDLAFYSAKDFARFREEIMDEQFDKKYAAHQQQKKECSDRRKRGYSMMGARRLQRNKEGRHLQHSIQAMRSHAVSKAQKTQ